MVKKVKKPKTVSKLKKECDMWYSRYRRLSESYDEYVSCVTCGNRMHWKEAQNGHYVDRHHNATRFLDKNCHPQCVGCNVFGGGKHDVYALYLLTRYGADILGELNNIKSMGRKFKTYELEAMIKYYKEKVKELLNQ